MNIFLIYTDFILNLATSLNMALLNHALCIISRYYFIHISVIQSFLPLRKIVFLQCKNTIFLTYEDNSLQFVCSKNLLFCVHVSEINKIVHGCLEI